MDGRVAEFTESVTAGAEVNLRCTPQTTARVNWVGPSPALAFNCLISDHLSLSELVTVVLSWPRTRRTSDVQISAIPNEADVWRHVIRGIRKVDYGNVVCWQILHFAGRASCRPVVLASSATVAHAQLAPSGCGRAVKAVKRRTLPRHSPGSPANRHSPASMFKFVMFFDDAAWISTGEAFRVVQ